MFVYFLLVLTIALMATTNAAAATNAIKLPSISCRYPTGVISCPIEIAPKLPTANNAITATRNSVVFFLSMLSSPTTNPSMNNTSRIVGGSTAVTNAARIATTIPTMNAHFPIKSNSMLYLFLVVILRRKVFK